MLQSVSKQSFKAVGAMYALLILVLSQPFAIEIRKLRTVSSARYSGA